MALTIEEKQQISEHLRTLLYYRKKNLKRDLYYEAKAKVKNLNASVTDKQQEAVASCSGFGRTVIDTLAARMKIDSIHYNGIGALEKIVKQNRFHRVAAEQIPDILLYGTGYLLIGQGDVAAGEPKTIITPETPMLSVGKDNLRTRRLDSFLKVIADDTDFTYGSFYTKTEVIYVRFSKIVAFGPVDFSGTVPFEYDVVEVNREQHNYGFVPAVRIANMKRTSNTRGESELTDSIMYFIDAINRAYGNAEWNSEYYAHPKRYLAGIDLARYTNEDGTPNTQAVSALMQDMIIVSKEEGEPGSPSTTPTVGQLQSASPAPYVDLIKQFESEIAREKFIPEYYLNAGNSVPTAYEAMSASEHPLNLSIQSREDIISEAYLECLKLALIVDTGSLPDEWDDVEVEWKDTTTISIAARTDALTKLIATGAVQPDSPIVDTFIPFTVSQRKHLEERRDPNNPESQSELAAAIRTMGSQLVKENQTIAESANTVTGE